MKTTVNVDVTQGTTWTSKLINLNEIPNEVAITVSLYNSKDLNKVSGQTVYLVRDDNNATIDTQITNSNGQVVFEKVSGNTVFHLVNESNLTYKKTNGSFKTADVDRISKTTLKFNATCVEYLYTANGELIPAKIVQMFKPLAYNTEFLLGHLRLYYPPSDGRQVIVDQFNEAAELLGMQGAIIPYDKSFPAPSQNQIKGYNPYPDNRQVYPGEIGTNITN